MSKVAIIRCNSYDPAEVKAAMQRGFDLLGGASAYVKQGEKILLKPNWIMAVEPERCATTHPEVFRAVSEILQAAGAELSYGDSPGRGTDEEEAVEAAKATGFWQVATELGIPLADFVHGREVRAASCDPNLTSREFYVANAALDCDGMVSLPKLKTHGFLKLTGAIKNQLGCIPGRRKGAYHRELERPADFARMLIDLNMLVHPRLYVMDGIMAMEGNGPMNGDPRPMNVLLLSPDPVALDATVCRLMDVHPEYSYTVALGRQAGHGSYLESEVEYVGDPLDDFVAPDFLVNRDPISNLGGGGGWLRGSAAGVTRPYIVEENCLQCGDCIEACPLIPPVLSWLNGDETQPPVYDYDRCIRCFCCQELCPHGAIFIEEAG